MNQKRIGVGLVGCGQAGRGIHVPLLAKYADRYTLVCCTDTTAAAAEALARDTGARVAGSVEALVADPAVDLVVVATRPPGTHRDVALVALAGGKHVVVEKPMAETAAQCAEMIAAATRAGRVLSVHHNRRWDVDFLTARALIASGALGQMRLIRNEYTTGFGGSPYDWGIHLVDQTVALSFGSRFVEITAAFCRPSTDDPPQHQGFFTARLRTTDGVLHDLGMFPPIRGTAYRPGRLPYRFMLVGTEGMVYQDWCQRPEDAYTAPVAVQFADAQRRMPALDIVKTDLAVPDFYELLYRAVREGGDPPVPATEALRSVVAWEHICRAAVTPQTLAVDF